jgi:hypothetical protein
VHDIAPMFKDKSGSSDPIGTSGNQSAYQRSVFWEKRILSLIAVEIVDR